MSSRTLSIAALKALAKRRLRLSLAGARWFRYRVAAYDAIRCEMWRKYPNLYRASEVCAVFAHEAQRPAWTMLVFYGVHRVLPDGVFSRCSASSSSCTAA